ncbi:MAG: GNAT family N-acetyltransferase [Rubrivivax sp.]|nr:GNAT family N-acetyltransferase [Rubrivivax sp.]
MIWTWARWPALRVDDLYDALALRAEVFVLEQGCAFVDPDGADRQSAHLLGRNEVGDLLAYLRVVDPGIKYPEPAIGRVVTAPAVRGTGLGRALMAEGLQRCEQAWPGCAIALGAQAHLERFYGSLGFARRGEAYVEDGIPHVHMLRVEQRRAS